MSVAFESHFKRRRQPVVTKIHAKFLPNRLDRLMAMVNDFLKTPKLHVPNLLPANPVAADFSKQNDFPLPTRQR